MKNVNKKLQYSIERYLTNKNDSELSVVLRIIRKGGLKYIKSKFKTKYKDIVKSELDVDSLSEDILSKSILEFYKDIYLYNKETSTFRTWFFKILSNNLVDEVRSVRRNIKNRKGYGNYITDEDVENPYEITPEVRMSTFMEYIRCEVFKLPEIYSYILYSYLFENKKYQEISEMYNIPLSSVKYRIYNGKKLIKDNLYNLYKDYVIDDGDAI